jgi:hypothetical protein
MPETTGEEKLTNELDYLVQIITRANLVIDEIERTASQSNELLVKAIETEVLIINCLDIDTCENSIPNNYINIKDAIFNSLLTLLSKVKNKCSDNIIAEELILNYTDKIIDLEKVSTETNERLDLAHQEIEKLKILVANLEKVPDEQFNSFIVYDNDNSIN